MITLTYGFGVALAAFAGVLAAPIIQVSPLMGSNLIIVVFAVVVIGGMGSILGSIFTGLGLGVIEGLDQGVLSGGLLHRGVRDHGDRAAGAAGRTVRARAMSRHDAHVPSSISVLLALLLAAPFVVYPVLVMKVLCFALFACAFNLLLGLHRPAVLRSRRLSRHRRLRRRLCDAALGPDAGAGPAVRHAGRGAAWARCSARWPSVVRASTSP